MTKKISGHFILYSTSLSWPSWGSHFCVTTTKKDCHLHSNAQRHQKTAQRHQKSDVMTRTGFCQGDFILPYYSASFAYISASFFRKNTAESNRPRVFPVNCEIHENPWIPFSSHRQGFGGGTTLYRSNARFATILPPHFFEKSNRPRVFPPNCNST